MQAALAKARLYPVHTYFPLLPLPHLECLFVSLTFTGFTTIHVTPHVNPSDLNGKPYWRNVVNFDPLLRTGPPGAEFSYDDVLLTPAAMAINAVAKQDTSEWQISTHWSSGPEMRFMVNCSGRGLASCQGWQLASAFQGHPNFIL